MKQSAPAKAPASAAVSAAVDTAMSAEPPNESDTAKRRIKELLSRPELRPVQEEFSRIPFYSTAQRTP